MLSLAWTFLKIGAASYGGGWTIVGIIRTEILEKGWLGAEEFARLVAMAQVTPGPVALNAATIIGYRLYGLAGAVLATGSVVTVPVILAVLVSRLLNKPTRSGGSLTEALKTGTIGLISMTVWAFAPSALASWPAALASAVAFVVSVYTKINPLWVILGSGAVGAVISVVAG